ncbi:MAG: hypothetical protein JSW00_02315 [Thermoplasmata archaeon]|nr:MAG: hypothetical protein JSW00_02315 [Thermoplasmata archaeon]
MKTKTTAIALCAIMFSVAFAALFVTSVGPPAEPDALEAHYGPINNGYPSTPVVGNISGDELPEIIFSSVNPQTLSSSGGSGRLNVIRKHANDTVELVWSKDLGGAPYAPAIGDLNNDGIAEIVVFVWDGTGRVYAIEPNGSILWVRIVNARYSYEYWTNHAPAIGKVNDDSYPDVVVALSRSTTTNNLKVLSGLDGSLIWEKPAGGDDGAGYNKVSVLDLDDDANNEVICAFGGSRSGRLSVYRNNGTLWWTGTGTDFAVADLELDGYPEIITVQGFRSASNGVFVYRYNGTLKWMYNLSVFNSGPAVSDLDLDGYPEIAVGTRESVSGGLNGRVLALNGDGSVLWNSGYLGVGEWDNPDLTNTDLNGDGSPEVTVISDDIAALVLDGMTGNVTWNSNIDIDENEHSPVIADVDLDDHAEIVVPSGNGYSGGGADYNRELLILGNDDTWVECRPVWNQMAYYFTNVRSDLSITNDYQPWKTHNTWRTQLPEFNDPPVANAGPDQTVYEGDTVQFNGTGSYDPDPKVDMVFVVDTSPSMPDEWNILSRTLPAIEQSLEDEGFDLRFRVYGLDHGNTYNSSIMDGWMDYGIRIQPNGSTRLTDCLRNPLISNPHGHNVNTANPSPCLLIPNQTCDSHSTHVSEGWAQGAAYVAVHHYWRAGALRIVSPIGDSAPWHQHRDGVSGSGPSSDPYVWPQDWDTINGTAIIANENKVLMFPMYDEACDPDGPNGSATGPIQDLFISLGAQTNGTAYEIDDEESFIDDVTQLIKDSILTYTWDFDANVDSDSDGNPTNDVDATGPMPTHVYGDDGDGTDGNYTVTLTVMDFSGLTDTDTCVITVLNVDPDVSIESATMDVEIKLRVAGSKWSNVGLTLYEGNSSVGYLEVERWPGNPDNNPTYVNPALPTTLDMTKTYRAVVTYDPYPDSGDEINGDQGNNGKDKKDNAGNPVWVIIKFPNGSEEKVHHTFNTQQSMIRDSDHWNHVEPWEVDISALLIGHPFEVTSDVSDPGSDDETITYTYGTQTVSKKYYNNAPTNTPDPYPSPEVNPVVLSDTTTLIYEGSGTLTLTVKDDDNFRLSTAGSSDSITIG